MTQSCMRTAPINQMREAELIYAPEPLEARGIEQRNRERVVSRVSVDLIAVRNYLFHRGYFALCGL